MSSESEKNLYYEDGKAKTKRRKTRRKEKHQRSIKTIQK